MQNSRISKICVIHSISNSLFPSLTNSLNDMCICPYGISEHLFTCEKEVSAPYFPHVDAGPPGIIDN